MPKKTYTVKEVADLLGFSTNTVYKYLDEGRIKSTRLGKEGRFRILGSELSKLLQEGKTGQAKVQTQVDSSVLVPAQVEIPESRVRGAPSLFDWFIAFLSISLGFSQFIFPSYYVDSLAQNFKGAIVFLQSILFIGGFVLIGFDILRYKKDYWHNFVHLIIAFIYLVMTVIFVKIGAIPNAVGYFSVSLIVFITVFVKLTQHARFILFANMLILFLGIGFLVSPGSFFLTNFVKVVSVNLVIFILLWLLSMFLFLYISFLAIRRNRKYIWFIAVPTAIFSLLSATFTFTNGLWTRAIYCVVLASFALIFPFADHFESFTLKSKKELIGSFAWLLGLFMISSAMLFLVYRSFQSYAFGELTNRVNTASDIINNFMGGNIAKVSSFATDSEITESLGNSNLQNFAMADRALRRIYQASDGTFRRVVLTNRNGIIIDTYPFNLSSQGVDISDRDYFKEVKFGAELFITGIIQPSSAGIPPAILISVPVKDSKSGFLGTLTGSVDLTELTRRITQVEFGKSGMFLLTDSTGNYIIPPTPEQILTKAESGSIALRAVGGESGTLQGYDANGNLSLMAFRRVDNYGWGIVAQQPFSDIFAPYSLAGFIIFVVFLISGVGSLVLVIYLRKKGSDKLL